MMVGRQVLSWLAMLCLLLGALVGSGCESKGAAITAATTASAAAPTADAGVTAYSLTIYGYNYTDTEIGSFEVNGQGGGNVLISSPTSGGSKSVCCVTLHTPLRSPTAIRIKWTRDSETWCEQEVLLAQTLPVEPEYLEVHFYRDGHIEVAVTAAASPPRLVLERPSRAGRNADASRNANNDSSHARCKIGYN